MSLTLPDRNKSENLLKQYIRSNSLREHCYMVAEAMQAYAEINGKNASEQELWWTSGLLHDLDWEMYPEEHPLRAAEEILPDAGYPEIIIDAVLSHAPERSGKKPVSEMECYLFACDELSGFMKAVALMRPNQFADMKARSVIKKMKDKRFAANVSRNDIRKGTDLIKKELNEHISFLISVFNKPESEK